RDGLQHPVVGLASRRDNIAAWIEHAPVFSESVIPYTVKNQIESPLALREILSRVVDDLIGADRPDELNVARACDPGDIRPERFRDLHSERSDAARRPIHKNALARLNSSFVAQRL